MRVVQDRAALCEGRLYALDEEHELLLVPGQHVVHRDFLGCDGAVVSTVKIQVTTMGQSLLDTSGLIKSNTSNAVSKYDASNMASLVAGLNAANAASSMPLSESERRSSRRTRIWPDRRDMPRSVAGGVERGRSELTQASSGDERAGVTERLSAGAGAGARAGAEA